MSYQNLVIIGGLTVLSTLVCLPTMAAESAFKSLELISQNEGNNLESQAKLLYEKGDYQGAIELLTKAITDYGKSNNLAAQIVPWRNLALLYAQIGDVKNANNAINYSIQGINYLANNYENKSKLLAQSLDVQGQIYLTQGNPENALSIWQKSAYIYHKTGDLSSFYTAKVNQVQALQNLGLYNKAITTLQELNDSLAGEKDSLVKAKSLLNLGSIYNRIGKFQEAEDNLTKSLAIAEEYQSNEAKTEALISLGNNRYLQGKNDEAIAFYQKALESAPNQEIKSQIELNKLNILVKTSPKQAEQLATEEVYNWLIKPAKEILSKNKIKNLVFIQDGVLRNMPVSALYDGEKYLIEKYRVSLAPGLQLIDPQALNKEQINMFSGGISESVQGFNALPGVETELKSMEQENPSKPLLNQLFTEVNINQDVKKTPYKIVHLATHGVFSSNVEDTFILTYDGKININELNALLRKEKRTDKPIELLVLSACQTAVGDERAALGLAGVAVRAGTRSTLASLWSVSDDATMLLMSTFYREIAQGNVTKSEAFQRAQIAVLKDERFADPYYWSAFVMLGNWL